MVFRHVNEVSVVALYSVKTLVFRVDYLYNIGCYVCHSIFVNREDVIDKCRLIIDIINDLWGYNFDYSV